MTGYVLKNTKWGAGYMGIGGGQVYWSFAQHSWGGYDFDAAINDETFRNLVRQAFDAWEKVANIDFVEIADGPQSQLRLGWDAIDGRHGPIGEAGGKSVVSGKPLYSISGMEIRFDTAENWQTDPSQTGGDTDFYTTALHEIGHALGLGHTDDKSTVMYPTASDLRQLGAGDIEGVQKLYGAKAQNPVGEVYAATDGNDLLPATAANDHIDGLKGVDTVVFEGARSGFGIRVEAGKIVVTGSGTDELFNIERLRFTDGTLAFDAEGNAGQAYRLYQAAFDRIPDKEGLGFWIDYLDKGKADLAGVAKNFIASAEFVQLYGNEQGVTNGRYVELLYHNALDRAYDQGGYDYWLGQLNSGSMARNDVLVQFSESNENKQQTAAAIVDGIWYA